MSKCIMTSVNNYYQLAPVSGGNSTIVLSAFCLTHQMSPTGSSGMCPIGMIEDATEKALKVIDERLHPKYTLDRNGYVIGVTSTTAK